MLSTEDIATLIWVVQKKKKTTEQWDVNGDSVPTLFLRIDGGKMRFISKESLSN